MIINYLKFVRISQYKNIKYYVYLSVLKLNSIDISHILRFTDEKPVDLIKKCFLKVSELC